MSDLISRQDAIEAIAKVKNNMNIGDITHYTLNLIDAIDNLRLREPSDFLYVDELPEKGKAEKIYIVPRRYGTYEEWMDLNGTYEEWMYLNGAWTYLGETAAENQEEIVPEPAQPKRIKCPNCGAPLTNGHCSYCGVY